MKKSNNIYSSTQLLKDNKCYKYIYWFTVKCLSGFRGQSSENQAISHVNVLIPYYSLMGPNAVFMMSGGEEASSRPLSFRLLSGWQGDMSWQIYCPPPPMPKKQLAINQSTAGGLTGPGLTPWHPGLYLKKDTHTLTLTLTLFPSLNNISNSWDCCHVFGLRCCSPGATCTDRRGWAIRHTRVQLLDFHITATTLRRIINRLGSRSSSLIGLIHSVLQTKTNHAGVVLQG